MKSKGNVKSLLGQNLAYFLWQSSLCQHPPSQSVQHHCPVGPSQGHSGLWSPSLRHFGAWRSPRQIQVEEVLIQSLLAQQLHEKSAARPVVEWGSSIRTRVVRGCVQSHGEPGHLPPSGRSAQEERSDKYFVKPLEANVNLKGFYDIEGVSPELCTQKIEVSHTCWNFKVGGGL